MKYIISSLIFAFSFLTRMPVPFNKRLKYNESIISNSVIFFPVVGLFFGLIMFAAAMATKTIIFEIQAVILLAIPYILNRFLHFDGLCDVADAFLSDKSKSERLDILKDSRIGSFALGFIILFMMLKFYLLKTIMSESLISLLIIVPVISRYSMVLLSYISSYPRKKGTAKYIVGNIRAGIFIASTAVFILTHVFYIILCGKIFIIPVVLSIIIVIIYTVLFRLYSYQKIGGVTGDVLGADNELAELIVLIVIVIYYGAASYPMPLS